MRIRIRHLVAAGAVAALCGAPLAAADPSCTDSGSSTVCSSPGNVQLNESPPVDDTFTLPYWDEAYGTTGVYPGPYPVPYDEGSDEIGVGRR